MMEKEHILEMYITKLNHIKLTYASLILWNYPDIPRVFKELYEEFLKKSEIGISELFPDIERFIDDEVALKIATEELYASAHRAAIKELYSFTKYYCNNTGQLDLLKSQPWFQVWRMLRNCWSHDMKLHFSSDEKADLPVEWSGLKIDILMDGRELTHGDFSYEKIRELLEEAQKFVKYQLT